jgi:hypothetical protein
MGIGDSEFGSFVMDIGTVYKQTGKTVIDLTIFDFTIQLII